MADAKRRLPVLKSDDAPGDARPAWHWIGFGALMIFTAWLPLAYVGEALVARWAPLGEGSAEGRSFAGPLASVLVPVALAAAGGGFVVGRFGKPAAAREAGLAGLAAGAVAVAFTALSGGWSPLSLVVTALTTLFAGVGGALGRRGRPA
jgi:hypothetical protein